MVRSGRRYMVEPMSWRAFYDEVGRFLMQELGARDDSELRTVLAVQAALMPAAGTAPSPTPSARARLRRLLPRGAATPDGRSADRRLRDYPPGRAHRGRPPRHLARMPAGDVPDRALAGGRPRSLLHEGEFWQTFNWELAVARCGGHCATSTTTAPSHSPCCRRVRRPWPGPPSGTLQPRQPGPEHLHRSGVRQAGLRAPPAASARLGHGTPADASYAAPRAA